MPRIIRRQRMWKASSFRRSSCRSVHVSESYNKMDSIQDWYRRSFVCSWSRVCRQTLFIECMAVEAMPMHLIMSGWHMRERWMRIRPELLKFWAKIFAWLYFLKVEATMHIGLPWATKLKWSCNKTATKLPTAPDGCSHTTLWNETYKSICS